jgi:hypothetical protein
MYDPIPSQVSPFVQPALASRLSLAHRFALWMLRRWHAACRRAERNDRSVPYY